MGTASGIATNDFSPYVGVYGDVLVACIESGKVLLWTGAAALSGETTPTQTVSVPNSPLKAVIGPKSGRLYVLESDAVSIYETPTMAPVLAARITSGVSAPRDFVVLEMSAWLPAEVIRPELSRT